MCMHLLERGSTFHAGNSGVTITFLWAFLEVVLEGCCVRGALMHSGFAGAHFNHSRILWAVACHIAPSTSCLHCVVLTLTFVNVHVSIPSPAYLSAPT